MQEQTYNIFVYGTLLYPEVRKALTLANYTTYPGILQNFERYCVKGEIYPAIKEERGKEVAGEVIELVSQRDKDVLDAFEGDEYLLQKVQIHAKSKQIDCYVYVYNPAYYWKMDDMLWKPENVSREEILRKYCGE